MARPRDPQTPSKLLAAAAEVLANEGRDAVTVRRLATEIGASTMAVYTHFGSLDDVLTALYRDGFDRFGAALDAPPVTDDPVADWMQQGRAYRRFALENRHLYRVMFHDGLVAFCHGDDSDQEARASTFFSLLGRIEHNVAGGRWTIGDLFNAGQVVWATSHGHMSIELTGYFDALGRDAEELFDECMVRVSVGFGDSIPDAQKSLARARGRTSDPLSNVPSSG